MRTVNKTNLSARQVCDPAEIERLRWFQHHRYVEAGLLSTRFESLPDDPAVARSIYFGVYDGDQVAATARIVRSGTMPMFVHHQISQPYSDRLTHAQDEIAEISRLAVGHTAPHFVVLSLLCRELLRFGLSNRDASLLVASVEQPLVRILGRLMGVPLHIIGDEIAGYGHYHGACLPILIDTVECLRVFSAQDSRLFEFFTEDLLIDLTVTADEDTLVSY